MFAVLGAFGHRVIKNADSTTYVIYLALKWRMLTYGELEGTVEEVAAAYLKLVAILVENYYEPQNS
jgi:hypothetical protein